MKRPKTNLSLGAHLHLCFNFILVVGLIIILAFIVCPFCPATAQATTDNTRTVPTNISLVISPLPELNLQPDSNNGFNSVTSDLTVSTNSKNGFKVILESLDAGNLTSPALDDSHTIKNLPQTSTPNDFDSNSWGYYIAENLPDAESLYQPIPTDQSTIIETDTASSEQTYKLTFGAKVDYNLPSGIYNTTLLVSAVANPTTLGALGEITYMSELTSNICANTPDYVDKDHYATKQLIDNRDGKSYWVAKLADGNCWMVQNLSYAVANNSWAWGDQVVINPTLAVNNFMNTQELPTWKPTLDAVSYTEAEGLAELTAVKYNVPSDQSQGGEYDPHYSIGRHYTYAARQTSCPANWQWPDVDTLNKLLGQYGVETRVGGATSTSDNELGYNIAKPPLYFVRSGLSIVRGQQPDGFGTEGWYTTNTQWANSYVRYIVFNNLDVFHRDTGSNYASSVRCVVINQG